MAVGGERAPVPYGEGRQALVEAAIRLVARDGLAKLTYRSLTAEAGVSQGSLRHHFPNLTGVLEAALERCLEVTHTYLGRQSESLEDLFAHFVDSLQEHPEIPAFQAEVFLKARHESELQELARRHQRAYRERAYDALVASGVRPDDELVDVIVALAEGIVYQRVVFGASYAPVTKSQVAGSRRMLSALRSSFAEASGDALG
ncbi:TetR/AcrR family transcriptional regulator [Streptomyces carpinensis]|uniref:TetR/AcrR family transcriptional regulator n=1 Tax=Streptomyces carpinensis TaxID=66369 RepID=A0ABV1VWL9_9ACTN|nr:TetR/AcrR family transcriptional regulator [Streptomyces carpinensis]